MPSLQIDRMKGKGALGVLALLLFVFVLLNEDAAILIGLLIVFVVGVPLAIRLVKELPRR